MFPLIPPDDPFLINTVIFGIPLVVRWYGVMIVGGAMLAGWLAARRAERRGFAPDHIWNLLLLGMVLGILGARIYYVAFEWKQFDGDIWRMIDLTKGGLAIHGALIGAIAAALIYTRRNKLPFVEFLDICMPGFLLAQAVGRWGNFFNQEAYGRPTSLPFGVRIDEQHRLDPYRDTTRYPVETTLFHATFLYESIWNFAGVGLLLWLERRLRGWLRTGDIALLYAIYYGIGRFWIEALRTDSLCINGIGGDCGGALRTAQVVSLLLIAGGLAGLVINHWRSRMPAESAGHSRYQDSGAVEAEQSSSTEPAAGVETAAEINHSEPEATHGPAQERLREARAASGESES